MARFDPRKTARRNCSLCWKGLVPYTPGVVTETSGGRAYHFHAACHVAVLADRAQCAVEREREQAAFKLEVAARIAALTAAGEK